MESKFSEWFRDARVKFFYWFVDYTIDFIIFYLKLTSRIMLYIIGCQMIYLFFKW